MVRVKHLIFPVDFVVIDIEEDANIPLIIGRPFMSTANCVVDMGKRKLQMAIEDQQISFDMFHEEKALPDQNDVSICDGNEMKVFAVFFYFLFRGGSKALLFF